MIRGIRAVWADWCSWANDIAYALNLVPLPDGEQLLTEAEDDHDIFERLAEPSVAPRSATDRPAPDVKPSPSVPSGAGHLKAVADADERVAQRLDAVTLVTEADVRRIFAEELNKLWGDVREMFTLINDMVNPPK